jgi:hypothetical protein
LIIKFNIYEINVSTKKIDNVKNEVKIITVPTFLNNVFGLDHVIFFISLSLDLKNPSFF